MTRASFFLESLEIAGIIASARMARLKFVPTSTTNVCVVQKKANHRRLFLTDRSVELIAATEHGVLRSVNRLTPDHFTTTFALGRVVILRFIRYFLGDMGKSKRPSRMRLLDACNDHSVSHAQLWITSTQVLHNGLIL